MEDILARKTASISEFKRNPAKVVESAGREPIAVLVHNKPRFYAMSAEVFEALTGQLDDLELIRIARERLGEGDNAFVEVGLEDL